MTNVSDELERFADRHEQGDYSDAPELVALLRRVAARIRALEMREPEDLNGKSLVDRSWYEHAMFVLEGRGGCPFCGSSRAPKVIPADKTFHQRRGCLDCNRWWDPVRTW